MWLKLSTFQLLGLIATILFFSFKETLAQTIEVASIHHSRFDVNSTEPNKGCTLNGVRMVNGSLMKLTNPDHFGPTGKVPYTLNFTHTFINSGSITEASLAPFQILFVGADFGKAYSLTRAEQEAIKKWSLQAGKVVIIAEQPFHFPLTMYYGYYLTNGNKNPCTVGAGDNTTKLFSGVFGNSSQINQGGDSQGYFVVDCFSNVIAKDANNRPTAIFHTETRDVLLGDTDFFTRVGNLTDGPNINNSADRIWANLWAWAVNEVINPGNSIQPVTTNFSHICNNPDGTITFTSPVGVSNMGEPYQYSIDGSRYQNSPVFTNLGPGTYNIYAKTTTCPSAQGDKVEIKVLQSPPKGVAVPMNCRQPTTSIDITDLPASGSYTINRQSGGMITASKIGTTDTGIPPGSYTYTVTNANGCTSLPSTPVIVELPKKPLINSIDTKPTKCDNSSGIIRINASSSALPIEYSLDNITFQSDSEFKGLKADTYQVNIIDANGCTNDAKVEIDTTTLPKIKSITIQNANCEDSNGSIKIDATGETPLSYSLDATTFVADPVFKEMSSGSYTIVIKDDNACQIEQDIKLVKNCVYLPNAITVNKDQLNDELTVYFEQDKLQVKQMNVFNRWGSLVYTKNNFEVVSGDPIWNGQVNKDFASGDIFVYTLLIEFDDKQEVRFRKEVWVMR